MRERGGQIDHAGGLVDGGRLNGRDLMLPERLAHDVEATGEGRIAEAALALPGAAGPDRVAVSDFSGLTRSAWALASAEARAATDFTGSGHGSPPSPGRQSSPRPISSASLARHARWPPWRPRASGP